MGLATIEVNSPALSNTASAVQKTLDAQPADANGGGSFAVAMQVATKPAAEPQSKLAQPKPHHAARGQNQPQNKTAKASAEAKKTPDPLDDAPLDEKDALHAKLASKAHKPVLEAKTPDHFDSETEVAPQAERLHGTPQGQVKQTVPGAAVTKPAEPAHVSIKATGADAHEDKSAADSTNLPATNTVDPSALSGVAPPAAPQPNDVSPDGTQTDSPDPAPHRVSSLSTAARAAHADVDGADLDPSPGDASDASPQAADVLHHQDNAPDLAIALANTRETPAAVAAKPIAVATPPVPLAHAASAEADFADRNHPPILAGISGHLLPSGGTMHIRLEPPELGDMQVTVHVQDGVVSASFQTSNDQATRLVSHSLGQLKSVLENAGVSVEKLHVSQAPRGQSGQSGSDQGSQKDSGMQDDPARRDRQRREMLQRLWKRLSGGDPLDTVA